MNTREIALLGLMIPLFMISELLFTFSPVPVSIFFIYIFRSAKKLSVYAWGIGVLIKFIIEAGWLFSNMLTLFAISYGILTDIIAVVFIVKANFSFSDFLVFNLPWSWSVMSYIMATLLVIQLHMNLATSILFVIATGTPSAMLICYLFKFTFDKVRDSFLGDVENRISSVLDVYLLDGMVLELC